MGREVYTLTEFLGVMFIDGPCGSFVDYGRYRCSVSGPCE